MPLMNSMGMWKQQRLISYGPPPPLFTNYFDSVSINEVIGGILLSTGESFVTGSIDVTTPGFGGNDGFIMKTDSYGNITYQIIVRGPVSISGSEYDLLIVEPIVDSSNNLYVMGRYSATGLGVDYRAFVAKFDSTLNLVWQKVLYDVGSYSDTFYDGILNEADDTLYVVGDHDVDGTISNNMIAKYEMSTGNLISQTTVTDTQTGVASSIIGDSSYYYVSNTRGDTGSKGVEISKWNYSDVYQWSRRINYANTIVAAKITMDTSSNVYLATHCNNQLNIVKLNSSGSIIWQRLLSSSIQRLLGITIDSSNNIYVSIYNSGSLYILKIDSSGSIVWQNSITDTGGVYASTISSVLDGIDWKGNSLWIGCLSSSSSSALSYNWVLPDNGSLTGTYADFTYATSSLSFSSSSLTSTTLVNTSTTLSLTDATGAATILAGAATQTVQAL